MLEVDSLNVYLLHAEDSFLHNFAKDSLAFKLWVVASPATSSCIICMLL